MAVKKFKTTSQLHAHIQKMMQKSLDEIVEKKIVPKLMIAIEETVYDGYTSKAKEPYERRRENDGLLDPRNIDRTKATWEGDTLRVKIRSIAKPNPKGDSSGMWLLDTIIVYGDRYEWKNSEIYWQQPYKRDFYETAKKVIERELPKLLADELKKKGININYSVRVR